MGLHPGAKNRKQSHKCASLNPMHTHTCAHALGNPSWGWKWKNIVIWMLSTVEFDQGIILGKDKYTDCLHSRTLLSWCAHKLNTNFLFFYVMCLLISYIYTLWARTHPFIIMSTQTQRKTFLITITREGRNTLHMYVCMCPYACVCVWISIDKFPHYYQLTIIRT